MSIVSDLREQRNQLAGYLAEMKDEVARGNGWALLYVVVITAQFEECDRAIAEREGSDG